MIAAVGGTLAWEKRRPRCRCSWEVASAGLAAGGCGIERNPTWPLASGLSNGADAAGMPHIQVLRF